MIGQCKLCGELSELQLSHIIPNFISKWLKSTSITGFYREHNNPSIRHQDISKEYLLCSKCEELFSAWEQKFATYIFYPYINERKQFLEYADWLPKFCASLSWRTLVYIESKNVDKDHDNEYQEENRNAKKALEDYILGKQESLFQYEQHLYPLDVVTMQNVPNCPPNINRYFLRAIALDVIGNSKNKFIYTKLPSFILLGAIKNPESKIMRSSRICQKKGSIFPRRYIMPSGMAGYLFDSARAVSEADSKIPERQQSKIKKVFTSDPDHVVQSGTFNAFLADLDVFGNEAFSKK